MMDVDEDDPVVRELPVYLSLELARQLYLLQYPLRPADTPYPGAPSARIKPDQQRIELAFSLDTAGENYDPTKGSAIASATVDPNEDGIVEEDEQPMFPSGRMDSVTLRSTRVPFKAHYAVGVIADDKVHLSPLHGITQLRPAFTHLEEMDRIKQAASKNKGGKGEGGGEESRPYSTTFKRRETERAAAARMRSHSHLQKQSDAEPWVDLTVYGEGSPQAADARTKLLAKTHAPRDFGVSADAWVEYITRGSGAATAESVQQSEDIAENGGVLEHVRLLPLRDAIFTLMRRAQVLRFDEIVAHVQVTSLDEVFTILRQCAQAIDGVWVVKSDILYEKTTRGTSQSLLRRCRDYILLKFRNAEHITRTEIRQRFPIDSTQLQEMLEGIAVPVPGEDGRAPWTFCEPPDVDFMQTHDRIMQLEDERWAKDAAAFVSVPIRVDVGAASSASARSSAAHEDAAANVLPEVWVSQSLGPAIDADGNDLTLNQSLEAMCRKALQRFGVCRLSLFHKVIALKRSETPIEAVWQNDIRDDDIEAALAAVGAQDIKAAMDDGQPQSVFVFKTLRGKQDSNLQKYRDIILDLFAQRPRVKRHEILVAWEEKGLPSLAQSGYLRIMHELAESVSNHWRLRLND
eukprot:m.111919 g.111919  ORF g.111919 m.111919 type:complete len:632 (+) comp10768_c0_seq3:44-1939(+)